MIRTALLLSLLVFQVARLSAAEVEAAGYRLYPGDLIQVHIYDHDDLTVALRIPTDGTVSYPLLGELGNVVGMEEKAFRDLLQTRLEADFLRQAIVSTAVLEFGPRRAYVMGSVTAPGAVELSPFDRITATQAISQRGGFEEDANRAGAYVIREHPQHPERKEALALPTGTDALAQARDIELRPRDLVVVPQLDRVYIIGRVGRPGAVNLPSDQALTVSKAVSLAGGFLKFARRGEVQLIRSGEPVQTIDVQAILTGNASVADPVLTPGDTVFVPESRF